MLRVEEGVLALAIHYRVRVFMNERTTPDRTERMDVNAWMKCTMDVTKYSMSSMQPLDTHGLIMRTRPLEHHRDSRRAFVAPFEFRYTLSPPIDYHDVSAVHFGSNSKLHRTTPRRRLAHVLYVR